jgi:hypothetical protein
MSSDGRTSLDKERQEVKGRALGNNEVLARLFDAGNKGSKGKHGVIKDQIREFLLLAICSKSEVSPAQL